VWHQHFRVGADNRLQTNGLMPAMVRLPVAESSVSLQSRKMSGIPHLAGNAYNLIVMAKQKKDTFQVACPDCGAMLVIDAATGLLVSHTSAPRKRMFEDLETAAKAMREQDERKESIFRQSVDAVKNKDDLFEKKFAEALRKAKDAPDVKPLREFDLD
jgi:hypothetical protein